MMSADNCFAIVGQNPLLLDRTPSQQLSPSDGDDPPAHFDGPFPVRT